MITGGMRLDLLYVGLFAVVFPLWDHLVSWPALRRRLEVDPVGARKHLWRMASVFPWLVVAAGAALWVSGDRSWTSFGFSTPDGWRMWTALVLLGLVAAYYAYAIATVARSEEARASIRGNQTLAPLMPHTRSEVYQWGGVSLTAGFCEEFLYRGFFIGVFAPWVGWWGAAALSLASFAAGHAYQGWKGVLQTGIFGAVYTLLVAAFDSLWPAIIVHAVMDLAAGVMAWLALRDR
jgi:membrane protease YdiL (CAAX protease family)